MSDTASEVSILDAEVRELFGLDAPSCPQDKELIDDNFLFPDLDRKFASSHGNDPSLSGSLPDDDTASMKLESLYTDGQLSAYLESKPASLSMSKNAIAARENRLKKKSFVSNLEKSVKELAKQNTSLKKNVGSLESTVSSLRSEVEYLKCVIANQGTIGALLKNIACTQGVKFQSSEMKALAKAPSEDVSPKPGRRKRPVTHSASSTDSQKENRSLVNGVSTRVGCARKIQKLDHDYAAEETRRNAAHNGYDPESDTDSEDEHDAGVCLHVSNKKVSLEFCAVCSKKASHPSTRRKGAVAER